MCMPLVAWGTVTRDTLQAIEQADSVEKAQNLATEALAKSKKQYPKANNTNIIDEAQNTIKSASGGNVNNVTHKEETVETPATEGSEESEPKEEKVEEASESVESEFEKGSNEETEKAKAAEDKAANPDAEQQDKLDEAQSKIDAAKDKLAAAEDNQNSWQNRLLNGLTIAATGIGGMQLAQGIAEKSADSAADKDMEAYMKTMYCKYGGMHTVPFGIDPVELPGGNDSEVMQYRNEYLAKAASLKTRKEALGLKPGIESEEILDRASMGLYDDENRGVTGGHYASRYRAETGSEDDKKGLDSAKKEAKTRMIAGGVVAGVGIVGGIVGNSIINGRLGKLIKEKNSDFDKDDNDKAIRKIKAEMEGAGIKGTDRLNLTNLDVRDLGDEADNLEFKTSVKGKYATSLFKTSSASAFTDSLYEHLTPDSKKKIDGAGAKQNKINQQDLKL